MDLEFAGRAGLGAYDGFLGVVAEAPTTRPTVKVTCSMPSTARGAIAAHVADTHLVNRPQPCAADCRPSALPAGPEQDGKLAAVTAEQSRRHPTLACAARRGRTRRARCRRAQRHFALCGKLQRAAILRGRRSGVEPSVV